MICINGRFLTEHPTGVQRFASQLVRALATLRSDVVILAPPGVRRTVVDGVRTEVFGSTSMLRWEQIDLPLWLRRHGGPVLVNPANRAPLLYRRQLSTLHDLIPILLKSEFTLRFRLQFRFIARFGVVFGSRKVLTVSEFSRGEIRRFYKLRKDRVEVIPNAADPAWLAAGSHVPITSDTPFILVFGRSGTNRNVGVCLEAIRLLRDETTARLVCVGTPDPALVQAARDLDERCIFTGRVSDDELADLYRAAVCFVAPSLYEGFDLPPLEAQCSQAPVVASDIPVHREVLGDGAEYFQVDSPRELADVVLRLLRDPARRAAVARRGAENSKRFEWTRSARRLDRLIREVA